MSALAKTLFAATFLLLIAGGLVTSTESGLSVPDWPTTYGQSMFTFPPSRWVGGIKFEHSHRLIAATVGMLTVVLAIWLLIAERRRWVKVLGGVAVFAVCLQGLLGGLTVKYLLPTPISVAHACLAQTFFCLTLALAIFTSWSWREGDALKRARTPLRPSSTPPQIGEGPGEGSNETTATPWAIACFAVLYIQLVLGAWMRHSAAGLAIPDFPSSFGGLVPDHWNSKIAIHFAHRAWAVVVAVTVFFTVSIVFRRGASGAARRAARILAVLLPVQVLLGAFSIWTRKAVPVTVAHQTLGAVLLASATALAIFVFRDSFLREQACLEAPPRFSAGAAR
ncbi:MAG: COX15/CtaA family protein [Thermoanaerobaculia bacterium]